MASSRIIAAGFTILCCFSFLARSADEQQQQCFSSIDNAAAGKPSELWSDDLLRPAAPLPTNSFWLNYVLQDGSQTEYIHPYSVRFKQGFVSVSYPKRLLLPNAVTQVHTDDLSISCKEEDSASPYVVSDYDDLSVTLASPHRRVTVPLVRGSPYVTFVFQGGTPLFSTINAVLNVTSAPDGTKHRIVLNNGQTWLVYSSSSVPISINATSNEFTLPPEAGPFTGTIRVAVLTDPASESVLDKYSHCYATRGTVEFPSPFTMRHTYTTDCSTNQLLLLSLPMHRDILQRNAAGIFSGSTATDAVPSLTYNSIDGQMEGVVGSAWTLRVTGVDLGWHAPRGLPLLSVPEITAALVRDVKELPSVIQNSSTYFFGKAAARAARLALIAEEVGRTDLIANITATLRNSLGLWLDTSSSSGVNPNISNGIAYDRQWGGLVSRDGAADTGADFGLGMYNDHHFHWGYFVYAGAVLARLDPEWGNRHRCQLHSLVSDYMQHGTARHTAGFPRLRHFDFWLMHSWAGGLKNFADGRNQESTSEAVNAYYAASLLGLAFHDRDLTEFGLNLVAFETHGAQSLWHVPQGSALYEAEFVERNRIIGVLWANKRDTALWFGPPEWLEVRLGIQLLPVTPATEVLFSDTGFAKEVVDWASAEMDSRPEASDGWKGFVYALRASYDPVSALRLARQLKEYDDGNSATNLLWWIHSRASSSLIF